MTDKNEYDDNYPAVYFGNVLGWVRPTKAQINTCNNLFLKGKNTPFTIFDDCIYKSEKVRVLKFKWQTGYEREYLVSDKYNKQFWVKETELKLQIPLDKAAQSAYIKVVKGQ